MQCLSQWFQKHSCLFDLLFEPTHLQTGAWSQRLRPLGQTVLAQRTGGLQHYMSWSVISTISSHLGDMAHVRSWCVYFKRKVTWYTCSVHQIKGSCCWRLQSRPSCQETCWQQEIARLQMQQQKIIGLGVPPHIQTWFFHARGMNPLIAPPRPAASRSKINEFGNPLNKTGPNTLPSGIPFRRGTAECPL